MKEEVSDTKDLSEEERAKVIGFLQNKEDVERHLRAQRQRQEELEAIRRKQEEERMAKEEKRRQKEKRRARQDDRNMKRDEFGSECSLSEWSSEYDSLSSEGDADIQTIADVS